MTMVKGKKRWLDPINQATLNSSDFFRNCFVRNLQKIKFTSK